MLRQGLRDDTVRVPHPAIVEFVAAVTRPLAHGDALLTPEAARREAEELLDQFVVLYPSEAVLRTAVRVEDFSTRPSLRHGSRAESVPLNERVERAAGRSTKA